MVRRYSALQRQAANAAIGHGTGVLGDDKKVSASAASGTFLASDPLRPPSIITYDMKGDVNRSLNVLLNLTPLVTSDVASNTANAGPMPRSSTRTPTPPTPTTITSSGSAAAASTTTTIAC